MMEAKDYWQHEIRIELLAKYINNPQMVEWIDHEIEVNKVKPSKLRRRLNREEKEILEQLKTK